MKTQILLRVDAEIAERLDVLVDLVSANPQYSGMRVNKSDIQRRALLAGIESMEDEYGIGQKRK